MKIKLLSAFVLLPMLFFTSALFSQATTLAAGDIAVIHVRSDSPDRFAFITFVDINEGTGIYFSDCGATASGVFTTPCNEGAQKYTVPAGGLDAGEIIQFDDGTSNPNFATYTDSRIGGSLNLSGNGDQITVFQDATNAAGGTNAGNNANFIFIAHNSSTGFTGNPTDTNQSSLPLGLSDVTMPRTALGLGNSAGVEDENDNVIYSGTYDFSGFATEAEALVAAKNSFTDPANYYTTNTNGTGDTTYNNNLANIPAAIDITTLSNDEFLSNSFAVYPNPSNGNITIRNSGVALQNVTVTDLNGRTLSSNQMNGVTTNVDLSLKLTTGIYLMNLTSNDGASTTKKLIIK
ncbi:T9SS type A sorting domain-containing protein [Kordia jejudonensis]|uniref:T9SS type A sorting domain-containing protein n=1 Tax=Kordia jejudonensis TaxID=1348245 RepID=UPI000628FCF1|nr:T9SS type A sorting domain-containing protein [Kordia jejudonensis]